MLNRLNSSHRNLFLKIHNLKELIQAKVGTDRRILSSRTKNNVKSENINLKRKVEILNNEKKNDNDS